MNAIQTLTEHSFIIEVIFHSQWPFSLSALDTFWRPLLWTSLKFLFWIQRKHFCKQVEHLGSYFFFSFFCFCFFLLSKMLIGHFKIDILFKWLVKYKSCLISFINPEIFCLVCIFHLGYISLCNLYCKYKKLHFKSFLFFLSILGMLLLKHTSQSLQSLCVCVLNY